MIEYFISYVNDVKITVVEMWMIEYFISYVNDVKITVVEMWMIKHFIYSLFFLKTFSPPQSQGIETLKFRTKMQKLNTLQPKNAKVKTSGIKLISFQVLWASKNENGWAFSC